MFKVVRMPSILQSFFSSLTSEFHWEHADYFRQLVLAISVCWGLRNVTGLISARRVIINGLR